MAILLKNILATSLLLLTVITTIHTADPVFSPVTISDAAGNIADSNSTITWANLPSDVIPTNRTVDRVDEGLEHYYDIVNNFIEFLFMKGIPPGLVEMAANGTMGDVSSSFSKYSSYLMGYIICVAIGVLFILIFPIIACCFCVCRCCGKCGGGKLDQSESNAVNGCCKNILIIFLVIIVSFLAIGSVCLYLNNSNTSTAIEILETTFNNSFTDLKDFINTTSEKLNHIAKTNVDFKKDVLFRDLDNIDYLIGLPARDDLETLTDIRTLIADMSSLSSEIDAANTLLENIETRKASLNTSVSALINVLATLELDLDTEFSNCNTSCPPVHPDYTVNTVMDTTLLPDLTSAILSISVSDPNQTITQVESQLNSIPYTIAADANATINTLKATITSQSEDLKAMVNDVDRLKNKVIGNDQSTMEKGAEDILNFMQKYDKYRWYGGVALFCLVLLTFVLITLGIMFGIIGSCRQKMTPGSSFVANLGGVFLLMSVVLVCLSAALLMLLTVVTFIVGAPVAALICKPITNLEYMNKIWTMYSDAKVGEWNYYMGDIVLDNKSIPLTLTRILRDCKAGKSTVSSLKLDSKYNFEELFNYTKTLDFQQEINSFVMDLSSLSERLTTVTASLDNITTAFDINSAIFYSTLSQDLTDVNITQVSNDLQTYAAFVTNSTYQASILEYSNNYTGVQNNEYANSVAAMSLLHDSVANFESNATVVSANINSFRMKLYMVELHILNNPSSLMTTHLATFTTRILGVLDSLRNFSLDANGFWFSLGWCVFFCTVGMVFSVILKKYFHFNTTSVSPVPEEKPRFRIDKQTSSRIKNLASRSVDTDHQQRHRRVVVHLMYRTFTEPKDVSDQWT